jgi:signal transduction histidine kinase/ligand-binding sensor domain-containing protein
MKRSHLWLVLVVTFAWAAVACQQKAEQHQSPEGKSTDIALGKVVTDTLPAPEVINLSDFEPPIVIRAAAPRIDSLAYPFGEGMLNVARYSVLDGLPVNFIWGAAKDSEGNMWFSSPTGLSKFDGTSFKSYGQVNGLTDIIQNIFIDSKDRVWAQVQQRSMYVFDGAFFKPITNDNEGNTIGFVNQFTEDKNGHIWMGGRGGLYQFKDDSLINLTKAEGLADSVVTGLLVDDRGYVLISGNQGITQYDGTAFTPYTNLPSSGETKPRLLFTDSKGGIWYHSDRNSISRFDGSESITYAAQQGYSGGGNFSFSEDPQGNIWFLSDPFEGSKISRFDGNRFFEYSITDLGLSTSDLIASIASDNEGSLWVASVTAGVLKLSYSNLSIIEQPKTGGQNQILLDPFGTKWMLNKDGLWKYQQTHTEHYEVNILKGTDEEVNLFNGVFDPEGNLWFRLFNIGSRTEQLVKFDGTHFTLFGSEQGFDDLFLQGEIQILNDESGLTTRFSTSEGYVDYNGKTLVRQRFLPEVRAWAFLEDTKGNFWYGTQTSGLYQYDGTELRQFNTNDGIPHNFINALAEDPFGNIWLATDGGAATFDGTSFASFTAREGLSNFVGEIKPDTVNKVLWFSTFSGLATLDFSQINKEQPTFRHYNPLTGFDIGIIFSNLQINTDGQVVGSDLTNSFLLNYPALKDMPASTLRITNLQVNNQPVSWLALSKGKERSDSLTMVNEMGLKFGEQLSQEKFNTHSDQFGAITFDSVLSPDFIPVNLSLPFKNNSIRFEFATISPSFGKSTHYQYRLEGNDDTWSALSNKKEASYGNLPEGSYTLHVKALNTGGTWSEISYPFTVRPPWQRTWWAYLSYLLIGVVGLFTFISWRTRSLKSEKEKLEEEVTNRTSELHQSNLQLEGSLSELKAAQDQLIQQEKLASLGQLTAGIAHEIKNPLNFVNNFSEVSIEMIDEIREELALLGKEIPASPLGISTPSNANSNSLHQTISEILDDIEANLRKIHEHGTRADGIVKSMLLHSRGGTGKMEPSPLNSIIKEYVNLAFHGMRAGKDPINVDIQMELDDSIGEIPLIAEDFSRVILNLCNNAFDAMRDKLTGDGGPKTGYVPKLSVRTHQTEGIATIEIEDNGSGIPEDIKDNILQPFFTTKKGTQGTGLGLSITNDIIKAHGGEMQIVSEPASTVFCIRLNEK